MDYEERSVNPEAPRLIPHGIRVRLDAVVSAAVCEALAADVRSERLDVACSHARFPEGCRGRAEPEREISWGHSPARRRDLLSGTARDGAL